MSLRDKLIKNGTIAPARRKSVQEMLTKKRLPPVDYKPAPFTPCTDAWGRVPS